MKNYRIGNYTRITKAAARKLFENGKPVYFCPVNLRPGDPYNPQIMFSNNGDPGFFNTCLNAFEYYNCTCNETGRYTAFYIMEG